MAIQISPKATAGGPGQRPRTTGGPLAANRRLRGMALIGALVLALGASLALGRALAVDPAVPATGGDVPTGPATLVVPRAPAGACAYGSGAGIPGEGCAPGGGAPATGGATAGTSGGQQTQLQGIEVRDNGAGGIRGAGGPCLTSPEHLCP